MDDGSVIEAWSGTTTSIRELIVNCLRAVERFRAQDDCSSVLGEQLKSESLAKAALSEALGWADSIDNFLTAGPKEAPGPIGTQTGPTTSLLMPAIWSQLFSAYETWFITGGWTLSRYACSA